MATASRTYVFLSNAEGFADVGDDANWGAAWSASDGNPLGSLEWIKGALSLGAHSERARDTLQSWSAKFPGIPAGATITDVQVTGWDELSWNTGYSARQVRFRIVDSTGTTVHSAGELFDTGSGVAANNVGTPSAKGAGTSRAVDASFQSAATQISFEIQVNVTASGTGNVDFEQDNIAVTVTYTLGGPSLDGQVFWNDLGPSCDFGPDPFNEVLAPAASSPQSSILVGLGSAQAFGAITAVGGPVSVVVTGLGSAAQFGAIKANIAFSVVGLGSAQQFGLISLKFQVPSLASAAAFGVPQENIAFFVAGLGSAQAFGTVTASLGGTNQNVSATGLATAQAFGTPTPSPGGVTVTVTGLGSAKAFGVPQENIAFFVAGLGSAQAFGTITFTTGGVTISVTGLGSAQAFGFPTVTTPGGGPSFDPAIHGGRHR